MPVTGSIPMRSSTGTGGGHSARACDGHSGHCILAAVAKTHNDARAVRTQCPVQPPVCSDMKADQQLEWVSQQGGAVP